MIYIVGGAPRVGKSIAAKKASERVHATFISTDDVCSRVSNELSEEARKIQFPLPGFSGTASENVLTPEKRVELSVVSAKSLEPEIDRLISEALRKDESLVIEGVHLLPEYVRQLFAQHGAENFHVVFVGLTNVDSVVEGIMKNTSPDNWMRDSNPDVIRQVAEFVASFSLYIRGGSKQNDLFYQERTEDFEDDVRLLAERLFDHSEIKLPRK